ncbi:hypothetical protein HU200_021940 [Digitaria exilis]|uniref:RING-type domain-containing protein n=1 Tax=Digitaria exilis TaxID=1010633 RepID=A0A835EYJ8_9POAL|nr:hypothetical protein HU200_021940 [Digitaria exilis]
MPPPGEVHAGAESGDGVGTEGDGGVEEGHGRAGARVSAASGREGFVGAGSPPACCCVCMEPWTCDGDHRIGCIPCGHVYGRSCLEMWLQRCGNTRAKCPQCGEGFDLKHVTNLYAPGNMWDGCCHIQVPLLSIPHGSNLWKCHNQYSDISLPPLFF